MENKEQESTAPPAPIFLLDNNVIQAFLSKDTAPKLQELLEQVDEIGAVLAVSDIVLYESQKSIVFDPVKSGEIFSFIDQYITRYLVDDNVLIQAARVHEIYGSHENTKNYRAGISTEDIIIATTSMLLGAYVLTTDCNDFPAPFFKEVSRDVIYYEVKDRRKYKVIYVLQPDQQVIGEAVDNLTGANKVAKPNKKQQKKAPQKK